jgi:hypothetical protein
MKIGRQRNKRRADDLTTEDERWEGSEEEEETGRPGNPMGTTSKLKQQGNERGLLQVMPAD